MLPSQYQLIRMIGKGSFGDIYIGRDTQNETDVAIKVESKKANYPQLKMEAKIYSLLSGLPAIPSVYYFGEHGDHSLLVMELLGPSLEELFNECGRKFSKKTVLMLADQMLSRVADVHSRGFIHRDIKPDNFLIGKRDPTQISIIDFGLAKRFRDPKTRVHILPRSKTNLTGTARYASVRTHLGFEQSRRDDIECLGYVLAYFYTGTLPWQGVKAVSKEDKYAKISEKKQAVPVENFTQMDELTQMINYARSLEFEQEPDYAMLLGLFRKAMAKENYQMDYVFDWTIRRRQGGPPAPAPPPLSPRFPLTGLLSPSQQQLLTTSKQLHARSPLMSPNANGNHGNGPLGKRPRLAPTALDMMGAPQSRPLYGSNNGHTSMQPPHSSVLTLMQQQQQQQQQQQVQSPRASPLAHHHLSLTPTQLTPERGIGTGGYMPTLPPVSQLFSPQHFSTMSNASFHSPLKHFLPPPATGLTPTASPILGHGSMVGQFSTLRTLPGLSDQRLLIERLLGHRLPSAQTTRLQSLLVSLEELHHLQQRLIGTLSAQNSGPTPHQTEELEQIDRSLMMYLADYFPADQPGTT